MERYIYKGIISTFKNVGVALQNAKLCYGEEEDQESWIIDNMRGDWGDIFPMVIITKETFPLPVKLKLRWITLADMKCYNLETVIDSARMEEMWMEQEKKHPDQPFKYVVVGIAPYGEVALWLRSNINSVFFHRFTADESEFDEWERPVYASMSGNDEVMKSIFQKEQYESIMQQYNYRYVPLEEYFDGKQWRLYASDDANYEDIDIECVEDKRVDGTFDFTDSDSLMKYHITGMPKRINVRWSENNVNYFAHFWLSPHYVTWFFESFHKLFPDTPVDLLIRIDTRANRYEVAMTAKDLMPRAFIGTQYIVFKDFEEIARSEYFDKEDGEWRWE